MRVYSCLQIVEFGFSKGHVHAVRACGEGDCFSVPGRSARPTCRPRERVRHVQTTAESWLKLEQYHAETSDKTQLYKLYNV